MIGAFPKPPETAGDLYIDTYGTLRTLTPSPECACCLDGVLDMPDGPMGYSIPRAAVVKLGEAGAA